MSLSPSSIEDSPDKVPVVVKEARDSQISKINRFTENNNQILEEENVQRLSSIVCSDIKENL